MNERIRQLAEQAGAFADIQYNKQTRATFYTNKSVEEFFREKFAELIVEECADIAYKTSWDDLVHGYGQAVIPLHLHNTIKQHFGVEECRGWVCPKCGVDRTKDVCPQGHMAAVEGKCPMIGLAQ